MIHNNFRSYQLSVEFYRRCSDLRCAPHLKSQLLHAASSITLNLAEGSGKRSDADRKRFYGISLGSVREVQAILDLIGEVPADLIKESDQLGGAVYRLCYPKPKE